MIKWLIFIAAAGLVWMAFLADTPQYQTIDILPDTKVVKNPSNKSTLR
jgi:hypothetical protein